MSWHDTRREHHARAITASVRRLTPRLGAGPHRSAVSPLSFSSDLCRIPFSPVMVLLFGGGQTHTLTAIYHLVKDSREFESIERARGILSVKVTVS